MINEEYNPSSEAKEIFDKINIGDIGYVTNYISTGKDLRISDPDTGHDLLFYAILCNQSAIVKQLACSMDREQISKTFISLCGKKSLINFVQELLPFVLADSAVIFDGLIAACKFGICNNVEFLLNSSAINIKDVDKDGKTLLMWARGSKLNNDYILFNLLFEKGADINHKDFAGNSILKTAFTSSYQPLSGTHAPDFNKIRWLLKRGVNIVQEDIEYAASLRNKLLIGMIEDAIEERKNHQDIEEALEGVMVQEIDSPISDDGDASLLGALTKVEIADICSLNLG